MLQHASATRPACASPRRQPAATSLGAAAWSRRAPAAAVGLDRGARARDTRGCRLTPAAVGPGAANSNNSGGGGGGQHVVVGDIGGTNARLSLWRCGDRGGPSSSSSSSSFDRHDEVFTRVYPVADHGQFERAYAAFQAEPEVAPHRPGAAALAVAGAVANNRCEMTNTPWVIDGDALTRELGYRVRVLNDFEAVGYGVPVLDPKKDLVQVSGPGSSAGGGAAAAAARDANAPSADARRRAPKVVMGPGTGLGAAQLFWDSGRRDYVVVPGEGSHATFAPRGWRQGALASWAAPRLGGMVEIEAVACGSGLELIYEFLLSDDETYMRPADLPQERRTAPEITSLAAEKQDVVAVEAVDMFLSIVGAEAGHMALRCLAYGGVYLAGGILPRLLNRVARGGLRESFLMPSGRERFRQILADVPLYIVTNTKVGLIGSRQVAIGLLEEDAQREAARSAAEAVM